MARKTLYKHSYKLGYNTRDNPTAISFDSAQVMDNYLPNDPNGIPRNGSEKWGHPDGAFGGSGIVLHTFAYSSIQGDLLICISVDGGTTSIYTKEKDTGSVNQLIVQDATLEFSSPDVSWQRILGDVYLSNGTDKVYILEVQEDGSFYFRNANIERPAPTTIGQGLVNANAVAGGFNLSDDIFIGYAVTYVRRNDNDGNGNGGLDDNGDPQFQLFTNTSDVFHPGVLESDEPPQDTVDGFQIGRTTGQTFSPNDRMDILLRDLDILDPQITHARLYRSLEFKTSAEALGASFRWLADFPVSGPNSVVDIDGNHSFFDDTSNATMAGNFNFSLNIGLDPMPAGSTMTFHKSRLWVGNVVEGGQEQRGRYYYSIPPLDSFYPQKWFSMYLRGTDSLTIGDSVGDPVEITGWKDTDHEDDEFGEVVDVSRNDIIFINSKSIWLLPDGNPEAFEPELIDRENGTTFSNSLVHIGDALYYLSNNGPAMIEGRHVRFLKAHTAGECWPDLYDGTKGYFFTVADRRLVKGYYVNENWILADNTQAVCMYMPYNEKGFGPWKFISAPEVAISFGIGSVFDDKELVVYPYNVANTQFFGVLNDSLDNDDGNDFTMRCKGKAQYMSAKDRHQFGEAASLLMFVQFTDVGQLLLVLTSDYARIRSIWTYDQRPQGELLQAGRAENKFRQNIFQPIAEGFLGQHFEVEWIKVHKTPYRFINQGWNLENIIRKKTPEFQSLDYQETRSGHIIETGTAPFDIIETGDADIEIEEGDC